MGEEIDGEVERRESEKEKNRRGRERKIRQLLPPISGIPTAGVHQAKC